MKKNWLTTLGCGAWIGGTMTVPGVSGGSMAMILGIYDRLIGAVNGVFKKDKRKDSLKFLAFFMLGAIVGVLLFAKLISFALENVEYPTKYFFLGAVAGGAPMIIRSANIKKFSPMVILWPLIGIVLALMISLLPSGLLEIKGDRIWSLLLGIIVQLLGGVFIAIAVVLPGISFAQVLYVLGLYEPIMGAVSKLDILALIGFIPLAIGAVAGVFLVTHVIELALTKYPTASYLLIFGFILGSLPELFPGIPAGWNIPICIVTGIVGFIALFFVSQKESA